MKHSFLWPDSWKGEREERLQVSSDASEGELAQEGRGTNRSEDLCRIVGLLLIDDSDGSEWQGQRQVQKGLQRAGTDLLMLKPRRGALRRKASH